MITFSLNPRRWSTLERVAASVSTRVGYDLHRKVSIKPLVEVLEEEPPLDLTAPEEPVDNPLAG